MVQKGVSRALVNVDEVIRDDDVSLLRGVDHVFPMKSFTRSGCTPAKGFGGLQEEQRPLDWRSGGDFSKLFAAFQVSRIPLSAHALELRQCKRCYV